MAMPDSANPGNMMAALLPQSITPHRGEKMRSIATLFAAMPCLCVPIHAEDIEWCPPKRSPDAHWSGKLRIASWNLANLHSENGKSI